VASTQLQPEPTIAVAVSPVGSASTTVTVVPLVLAWPTLETVIV